MSTARAEARARHLLHVREEAVREVVVAVAVDEHRPRLGRLGRRLRLVLAAPEEEERRLGYVDWTRAKDALHLSYSHTGTNGRGGGPSSLLVEAADVLGLPFVPPDVDGEDEEDVLDPAEGIMLLDGRLD